MYLHSLHNFRLEKLPTNASMLQFRVCISRQKSIAQIHGSTIFVRGNLLNIDVAKILAAVCTGIVFVKRPHYAKLERIKNSTYILNIYQCLHLQLCLFLCQCCPFTSNSPGSIVKPCSLQSQKQAIEWVKSGNNLSG